ncbi:hypothetical protein SAMN02910298_00358 [Pseudobutyrivibrio sp. YE44]|uniref:hypothetical protein n=1 Tax=Pseudobutyrivibrio sp. YE44 TaxID=1520802 RepID=UPI00088ED4D8|nr:hypothetical protein [Pseudobutyrivibrio sp. YE44]SDB08743.1 hypothetical protein SAMN02910298_00358 [Pseudobutyrivibrio sp. YE44]
MKLLLKNKLPELIKTEHLIIVFTLWNFVNIFLHLYSGFHPFISSGVEVFIYVIELVLFIRIKHRFTKQGGIWADLSRYINAFIYCDFIELYLDIFSADRHNKYVNMTLAVLLIIKYISSCFLYFKLFSYIEKNKSGEEEKFYRYKIIEICWIAVNVIATVMLLKSDELIGFCMALTCLKYVFAIYPLKTVWTCKLESDDLNKSETSGDELKGFKLYYDNYLKKYFGMIPFGIIIVVSLFIIFVCENIYITGDKKLTNENGKVLSEQKSYDEFEKVSSDVYIYSKENIMPEKSMFYDIKYGILNVKTGYNSGAIYDGFPEFDDDGIAPDYKGHFINMDGEIVFDIPGSITRHKSLRQQFLDLAFQERSNVEYNNLKESVIKQNHFYYVEIFRSGICVSREYNKGNPIKHYFGHGLAFYYSELNDCFGIISDDGKILTKPIFDDFSSENRYEVTPVHIKGGGNNVIDYKLRYLVDESYDGVVVRDVDCDLKKFFVEYDDVHEDGSFDEYVAIIDFDGNVFEDDKAFSPEDGRLGSGYFCLRRNDGSNNIAVFHGDKILYETNKYNKICIEYDEENNSYLMCKRDDVINILDVNGEIIITGNYGDYSKSEDDIFCLECLDDEHLGEAVIADLDGNIKYTGYKYHGLYTTEDDEETLFTVYQQVGPDNKFTIYNQIDTTGELVSDDWYLYKGHETIYDVEDGNNGKTLEFFAELNDDMEPVVHWHDEKGKEIFSGKFSDDFDDGFECDYCHDEYNAEYYGKLVFWTRNKNGKWDFFDENGKYIKSGETLYDFVYNHDDMF